MKLVIGGSCQGKREAACRLFACGMDDILDGAACSIPEIGTRRAVSNFHLFVKRWMERHTEGTAQDIADFLKEQSPELIVICNEIGCGIVPMDPGERKWRELTGRTCCLLAKYSDTVVRVTAGIPVFLKNPETPAGEYA